MSATLDRREIRLPGGRAVRFVDRGRGEALVLVHGVGLNADAFAPQVEHFADRYRVIAVDLPGHGSAALPGNARLAEFVAWMTAVIDALGTGPVNLAGHSMGALVAGGCALDAPQKVMRVALLNGVNRRGSAARSAVRARARAIAAGDLDALAPIERWYGDSDAFDAIRARTAAWLQAVDAAGYATAYRAFAEGDDIYADRWRRLACPALFLTADGDPNSTPAMSRRMAGEARRGRAVIVVGHRHMVNLTAPDAVNAALEAWLAEPLAVPAAAEGA